MLCDINVLTNDGHRWTQEDKFNLESQLLLHTNEPLCLDPSPAVFLVATKLNYEKQKFNSHILKKYGQSVAIYSVSPLLNAEVIFLCTEQSANQCVFSCLSGLWKSFHKHLSTVSGKWLSVQPPNICDCTTSSQNDVTNWKPDPLSISKLEKV